MSVTAPKGFRAAGVTAGLKASGRPDVALVVNDGPSRSAAAVFTSNRFLANPVLWSKQVVADGSVQAVRPQQRRGQLRHRPAGLPDHARDGRGGRRAARRRRG